MNILFITLLNIKNIEEHNIYSDLMRELAKNNNNVFIVSPIERRFNEDTHLIRYDSYDDWHKNVQILKIKTGNVQKTNVIEKGISTITLESKIKKGLKKYTKNIKFDLILYSTPPITIVKPIKYIVKRDNAKTYLMLKDIFPQNAVDLGMLSKKGIKGILYKFFRRKENKLYEISNKIGCMSQANVNYILEKDKAIDQNKVEIFPNCVECIDYRIDNATKEMIRMKYDLPIDKKIFVYGGNLGKPQDIDFIIDCLRNEKDNNRFFLVVGSGTEFKKLEEYYLKNSNTNFKLMKTLPQNDFDRLLGACDYGLIFLSYKFTIPNYPSRLLSYLQAGLPVVACTDKNTDVGKFITDNKIGLSCFSNDVNNFSTCLNEIINNCYDSNKIYEVLLNNFDVKKWMQKLEEIK